ncbi:MAG: hypothetical protein ACKOOG_07850, partial [Actinomycetota bacterium]
MSTGSGHQPLEHEIDRCREPLDGGGLGFAAGRSDASSSTVYGWAEAHPLASPFVADPEARSPVTAT